MDKKRIEDGKQEKKKEQQLEMKGKQFKQVSSKKIKILGTCTQPFIQQIHSSVTITQTLTIDQQTSLIPYQPHQSLQFFYISHQHPNLSHMNLRNLLYKQQYRSQNTFPFRNQTEHHERQYRKQLQAIQISLSMMNTAFKNNIKIQQIYVDLVKARNKKLNFRQKDIKYVYKILSDNKTDQIIFMQAYDKERQERKENSFMASTMRDETTLMTSSLTSSRFKQLANTFSNGNSLNHRKQASGESGHKVKFKQDIKDDAQSSRQKLRKIQKTTNSLSSINSYVNNCIKILMLTYCRLYSRLIEAKIKKLTYYILNKQFLQKIILHTISELSKRLDTLMRRIHDFRDFKFLYEVVKLIYDENLLIQQKIYELLVNEGHVVSMEEFFRINGIMMMEEIEVAKRRSSRMSVRSIQRLSGLLSQPISLDQLKVESKPKESRFSPQVKSKSKKKDKVHSNEKLNFNIAHAEKINKEIQSKYASALDKLGDLIQKGNQDLAILQKQINLFPNKKSDDQSSKRKKSEQNQDFDTQRFVRSKSKKKSTPIKRKNSIFQYFSSSFKEIIKQLDEKKGKTSQFQTEVRQTKEGYENHESPRDSIMLMKNASSTFQSNQFQKINNQTISLQNPSNVARLLSKKFKTLMPTSSEHTNYSLMSKKMHYSSNSARHNPIGKLLKIYQNKNKQSHIIDILFGTNFEDQDQKSLQKNFIKLSIMAKLKEKKMDQIKAGQIQCAKFEDFMMKEVQQEYEQLLAMKRMNKKRKTKGAGFQSYTQKDTDRNENNEKNSQKKRKTVILDKLQGESLDETNKQEEETFFNTQIQKQQQPQPLQLQPKNHLMSQSLTKLNPLESTCRTPRLTHQPNLSQTQMTLASHLNTFQCFQPNEFKKIETTYGEFTNPLTKTTGYYNQKDYTSLRTSLEKREVNSIIKLKKKVENKNLFEIGSNVSFWNSVRKSQQKSCDKINLKIDLTKVNEVNSSNQNRDSIKQTKLPKTDKPIELNPFQHQYIKKFVKWQKQHHPDQQENIKSTKLKPQRPKQLKILRLRHSRTERGSLKQINFLQNISQNISITQNKLLLTTSSQQPNPLQRQFCLNAKKIQKPNFELNQDELDGFIEKYLKQNRTIEASYGNFGKLNESYVMKDFSKVVTSMPASPRHSFKRIKDLYSIHRRTKVS